MVTMNFSCPGATYAITRLSRVYTITDWKVLEEPAELIRISRRGNSIARCFVSLAHSQAEVSLSVLTLGIQSLVIRDRFDATANLDCLLALSHNFSAGS